MTDWTPKTGKAEWHLTYRCNLRCVGCNRLTHLFPNLDIPDMTLDDAARFCREGPKFGFHTIIIIGGEPTLHPDFLSFVKLARKHFPTVQLFSNEYTEDTRLLVKWAVAQGVIKVHSAKTTSCVHHILDQCVAPVDCGIQREPCRFCSCYPGACGISVDSLGYTMCCCGGAVDTALGLNARAKQLSQLFNNDFAKRQLDAMCSRCGFDMGIYTQHGHLVERHCGVPMSKTWIEAWKKRGI